MEIARASYPNKQTSAMGKCLIYDHGDHRTYLGSFEHPSDGRQTRAHLAMLRAIQKKHPAVKAENCTGGALKQADPKEFKDAQGKWVLGQNSGTLNPKAGEEINSNTRGAHGNSFQYAIGDLSAGEYFTVSATGTVGDGQKKFHIIW